MIKFRRSAIFFSIYTIFFIGTANAAYTIEVTNRHLYGPGPFPDQKLKTAWIRNLELDKFLQGHVKGFNNLGEEPNVSGEILQGKVVDGMMSDKTLINEDIDMSNAVIMNGQFNLLLAAVFGGPNKGDTFFYTDSDYNWWIKDDIAIDPGFPAGVVKIDDFTFSTGPRIIPSSMQSELGYPGGTNQIGSLEAGRIAIGRLGDADADGFLDGIFNAIGRFPMDSIFLPGAPFVQLFEFKSDIPIDHVRAALLSIASARSYTLRIKDVRKKDPRHKDIPIMHKQIVERVKEASGHLEKAVSSNKCFGECKLMQSLLATFKSKIKKGSEKDASRILEDAFKSIVAVHEKQNA